MGGYAWVTLATNDSYSLGALVLAHSLKQVGTKQQLAVLITPGVTSAMRSKLQEVFNVVQEVNLLDSKDETNLRLLKRPELGITFTKLHCWRLTQFDKCVFLDADTLVLENCDELFEREELSAAPDIGWPDCFNSGVFVYRPSNDTYEKLVQFALDKGSFDGGDQGLLNLYFSDWAHKDISKHLPFIYNMASTACYSYLPAFKQFGGNAKIIHFIGSSKPWLQYFDTEKQEVHPSQDLQHLKGLLQHWWNIFCSLIHTNLSPEMAGIAGAFARLTLGTPRTAEQLALDDHLRRQGWEVGNIDYLGRDSFDNIWSKICETLSTGPEPIVTAAKEPTPPRSEEKPKPVEQPSVPATEVQTVPTPEKEPPTAPQSTEPTKVEHPVSETAPSVSEPPKPEETAKPVVPDTSAPETPSEPPKIETAPPKPESESEPPKSTPEPQPPQTEVAKPAAEPEPPKSEPEPPKSEPAPPKSEPEPPKSEPEPPKSKPEPPKPASEPSKSESEPAPPKLKTEPPKSEPPKPAEAEVPKTEAKIPKLPEAPAQTPEVPAVTPASVQTVTAPTAEAAKPVEPPAPSQASPAQESPKPEEPKAAESPKADAQVSKSAKVESQPEIVPESIKSAAAPEAPKAIAAPPVAESPKESPKPKGDEKKPAASKESKKSKDAPKAEATEAKAEAAPEAPAQESASGPTPPPRKASGEKKKTATKTKK